MEIADRIRDFVMDELKWTGQRSQLTEDFPLIGERVLDSLGIFQLVTFLENEYDIEVDDVELLPENFSTIGAVTRLVEAKR